MKTLLFTLLLPALALCGVDLLVACTQKGSSPSTPQVSTDGKPGQLGDQGTSTSGGGTGIDRKVFESYIVDPTQLEPVKDYIEPIFANIQPTNPNSEINYNDFFKMKTWFIAPVELDKINKDLLGISFIKSTTQQIARQTQAEVWVDKTIYDSMPTAKDQAELLLHEWVMAVYLVKFLPMDEICRISAILTPPHPGDSCQSRSELMAKAMSPEKTHPLDDQDNANIRFVVGWLLQHTQTPVSEAEYMRVLFSKGFDKRFFNPARYDGRNIKNRELSGQDIFDTIKGAELSGRMPTTCLSLTSQIRTPCKVTIHERSQNLLGQEIPGYDFELTDNNNSTVHIFSIKHSQPVSASIDADGDTVYIVSLYDFHTKFHVGDRFFEGYLILKEPTGEREGYEIKSIVLKPGLIVSIDKTRTPVCQAVSPKATDFLTDSIWLRNDQSSISITDLMLFSSPIYPPCEAENVD